MTLTPGHVNAALDLCGEARELVITVGAACMEPALRPGDKVRVGVCTAGQLRPGDIVLLRRRGSLFLHRYLGAWAGGGDGCLLCAPDQGGRLDAPWPCSAVMGRVVEVVGRGEFHAGGADRLRAYWRWFMACVGGSVVPGAHDGAGQGELEERVLCGVIFGRVWKFSLGSAREETYRLVAGNFDWLAEKSADKTAARVRVGFGGIPGRDELARRPGFFSWAHKVAAYLSPAMDAGEVFVCGPETTLAGLRAFFRLAAMAYAMRNRGVCLHASCVRRHDGALVFAGASGTGKTTAASVFGRDNVLDDDLVLLVPGDGGDGFCRLGWLPGRADGGGAVTPVRAILLPGKADAFAVERVSGVDAVRACLHLPPLCRHGAYGEKGAADILLAAVLELTRQVPVYRMGWRVDDDLPELLAGTCGV